MEIFQRAKIVRLKSAHGKYLTAEEDEESVTLDRNGSSSNARWTVEFVESSAGDIIRLKSCYGKYLTASNQPFLLGMTGRKVLQTLPPKRLDSSVEWLPVRDGGGGAVKLKTRYGQFLRANGGPPPWRNSVTHDVPHRTATRNWVLWEVHVVEIVVAESPVGKAAPPLPLVAGKEEVVDSGVVGEELSARYSSRPVSFSSQESNNSLASSLPKGSDGRLIYFHIADENGKIDEGFEELCIVFKGNEVSELTWRLEEELGAEGITVCAKSPLNGKLYPLRLQLPPNNTTMHVVVLPPTSQGDFT
ncbi:hypothetical protein STAS_08343 [Striga asiatica]|uniref:Uncharacterized protein n=1 Tax=Striga asiatica TaxID=4170 RepID=A0A5A7PHK8_STRAF|nr:hypothetical protein STAS_08343 [Striga asiatica]